jgi:hypothetical protein
MPICSRSSSKDMQWQRKRDPAFPLLGRPDLVTSRKGIEGKRGGPALVP